MHEPFVKIHKKITQWEWYTDVKTFKLFMHFLVKANYTDKRWRGMIIKKGQLITSYGHLSNETGLSIRSVRTSLDKLKKTGEVTCETTNSFTLIELKNYNDYNSTDKRNDKPATNERQTNDKRTTTTKEEKESKKRNKITSKEDYGNQDINQMLEALKTMFSITDFKEGPTWQRRRGKHLVQLREKIGTDKFENRLKSFMSDKFLMKRCGDLGHIYNTLKSLPDGKPMWSPEDEIITDFTNI